MCAPALGRPLAMWLLARDRTATARRRPVIVPCHRRDRIATGSPDGEAGGNGSPTVVDSGQSSDRIPRSGEYESQQHEVGDESPHERAEQPHSGRAGQNADADDEQKRRDLYDRAFPQRSRPVGVPEEHGFERERAENARDGGKRSEERRPSSDRVRASRRVPGRRGGRRGVVNARPLLERTGIRADSFVPTAGARAV